MAIFDMSGTINPNGVNLSNIKLGFEFQTALFSPNDLSPTSNNIDRMYTFVYTRPIQTAITDVTFSGRDFIYELQPRAANVLVDFYRITSGTINQIEYTDTARGLTKITITDLEIPFQTLTTPFNVAFFPPLTVGNDQMFGSRFADIIDAGTGNDEVYGYDGNDQIYGGDGNDYLVGENGDDQLFGGNGNDWLVGGAGNDWLVGGAGYDTLKGGDGDDGITYDAADNLSGYDGGAGFDTLYFNAADAPVPISLRGQNFEQAIGTLIDNGNEAWASITTVYNADWQATRTEFLNDDGSKSIWRFDVDNTQVWRELRSYYTTDGKLDYEQYYGDNGSYFFLDFDLANTQNWYSRALFLDANGGFISETFTYDAALAQRSTEIGAVKAAIKAAPVDALI